MTDKDSMQYVELSPELTVSRVAWGFWRWLDWGISLDELEALVAEVMKLGITTFDHADGYGNGEAEKAFGYVLKKRPQLRDQIQLITKCTLVYPDADKGIRIKYYDTSEKHIIESVEQSLRRMNTDYIDLLLLHRPDPFINCAEVASAFEKLEASGKVREFGVSNYKAADFDVLQSFCKKPLVTNQIEASVLAHENFDDRTILHAQSKGIHPIFWSPLAGGRIFTGEDDTARRVRNELEIVREEIGAESIDEVALAWLFSHPVEPITITGACELPFIKKPVSALKYRLTRQQWFAIWIAETGHKVP